MILRHLFTDAEGPIFKIPKELLFTYRMFCFKDAKGTNIQIGTYQSYLFSNTEGLHYRDAKGTHSKIPKVLIQRSQSTYLRIPKELIAR